MSYSSSNRKLGLVMLTASSAIALFAFTTPGSASTLEFSQKIIDPDGASNDKFGFSVALDGEHGLIGSFLDDDLGSDSGSAYLFDITSGNLLHKFMAPDGANGDLFGWSVALDANYALIGSHSDDDLGSAYVFDITSGNLLHKFMAPDGASGDRFGFSVALDGDYGLIGSTREDDLGSDSGSAYLFDITSGNLLQKFIAPDGASGDLFGASVALDGDSALIGSSQDYDGSAYLFDITSGDLLQKIIAPDGASGDEFGASVALDGDSALIGSFLDDDLGPDSGSAYLFTREEMEKVPEPSAVVGLIAMGTLGVLHRFARKKK